MCNCPIVACFMLLHAVSFNPPTWGWVYSECVVL
jgi:hypothetical protein